MDKIIIKASKLNKSKFKVLLTTLSESYYNNDINEEKCDDKTYDKIVEMYESKFNSPYKKVGANPIQTLSKITLPYYMGSLDKVKTQHKLDLWIKNMNKELKEEKLNFIITDKIDGVSVLYSNNDNKTILAKRGDGVIGTDISNLIPYFNLPTIKNIAVRGELVISKQMFEKYKDEMITARNMVSGITNAKHPDIKMLKSCSFLAYQYLDDKKTERKKSEQLKYIEKLGFKTPQYCSIGKIDIDKCKEIITERIKKSDYEMDGLVITADIETELLVNKNPKISIAYKEDDEGLITTVKEVEWNASKNGILKPTIIMEQIIIDDVKINRATAFNAKFIVDNNIGKGTVIEVVRSGKVIPYIKKVIEGSEEPDLPDKEYEWNETKVDIILKDFKTDENVIKKQITDFFKQLDAKFLGEKTIEKIYDSGFVTLKEIFNIRIKDLLKIEGIKQKSAERIKNVIKNSITNVSLCKVMSASGKFSGFGEKKIQLILDKYPEIMELYKDEGDNLIEDLEKIKGLKKLASVFINSLSSFISFLEEHDEITIRDEETVIQFIEDDKEEIKKPTLNEQIIVFTGFRDKTLEDKIKKIGGRVATAISGKTTMIVKKVKGSAGKESTKEIKAIEQGVTIMKYEDFIKKYF
jgi:DNA ligase (NAD+)